MSLKWKEIENVLCDLRPLLVDSTLQKVAQIREVAQGESFLFQGFGSLGSWRVWVCLARDHTVLCPALDGWNLESMPQPSTLVMVLRKHLVGAKITALEQVPQERFALIHFDGGRTLILDLMPKKANIILGEIWSTSERTIKVLQTFRKLSLETGAIYRLPDPPTEPMPETVRENFVSQEKGGFARRVAEYYWNFTQDKGFEQFKRLWRQAWKAQSKKIQTALDRVKKDFEEAREAERFQLMGKTLFAKLYEVGPRSYPKEKKIVIDEIEIRLDPQKSFSENAELLFKKSKKMTRASSELGGRVEDLEIKKKHFEEVSAKIEAAESEADLEKLAPVFAEQGLEIPELSQGEDKKESSVARDFLEAESSEGFRILVGRNQEENRKVTFHESKGNDLWLHVKGAPGAHVVIKAQRNKTVPLETLLEAAQLCLYHSNVRKGKRAEVDYTFRKNVRAIKGTVAEVTYTGNKALYLEADPEKFKKIL